MDRGRKLMREMEHESISPKEAIDTCLELVNKEQSQYHLELLVNALFYAMVKGELVYAAIHEDGPVTAANLIRPREKDQTFYLQTVNMPNGIKVIVVCTGPEYLKLVDETRYLQIGLDELVAYIIDLNVDGLLLNPGPLNYYVPLDIVRALLEHWYEYHKRMEKK